MKQADKELILRLADIYCDMANSPEGTPTSFTNAVKVGADFRATLEALDFAPLKGEDGESFTELAKGLGLAPENK